MISHWKAFNKTETHSKAVLWCMITRRVHQVRVEAKKIDLIYRILFVSYLKYEKVITRELCFPQNLNQVGHC